MGDFAVENKEIAIVEKVVSVSSEVDKEAKVDVVRAPATENVGTDVATDSADAAATKDNGGSVAAVHDHEKAAAEAAPATGVAVADIAEKPVVAAEENGEKKEAATPAEAVKRIVSAEVTTEAKSDGAATPDKRAKFDESSEKPKLIRGQQKERLNLRRRSN